MIQAREQTPTPSKGPANAEQPNAELAVVSGGEGWICCGACRARIAPRSALLGSDAPLVFANPQGLVYELITVRTAIAVHVLDPPTTEATWFDGYAWRVAICAACVNHLGWQYSAVTPDRSPATFFGFIRKHVVEVDEGAPGGAPT